MDTHIQPDPGSTEPGPLHVSLPEDIHDRERALREKDARELPPAPSVSPEQRLPPPKERPRRRRGLLLGVVACVLVVGGGGAYLISPYNTAYPMPQMASTLRHLADEAGIGEPTVLAPSAHLAHVNAPPLPPPTKREAYTPAPRKSEVDEILALKAGASAPSSATAPALPTRSGAPSDTPFAALVPGEPGGPAISSNPATIAEQQPSAVVQKPDAATPSPAARLDLSQSIMVGMRDHDTALGHSAPAAQVASPAAPPPASLPPLAPRKQALVVPVLQQPSPPADTAPPKASPTDAATAAAALQAAPMSTHEQVEVLEVVTRLGTLLADQREEVAQLRADLARFRTEDTARIDDLQRRLALAEARRAVAKISPTPEPAPALSPAPATPSTAEPAASVVRPTLVVARAVAAADSAQPVQRYRVQAASPGLAMLAAIDRAGDESAQLQVALGDTVPGYGRVKAVEQQGTIWVVKTERGTIGE